MNHSKGSALRRRMDEAMVLRGFSPRTREAYLACVTGLARHYHCAPDRLDADRIQAYLLYLITERKLAAYASVNQAACAIRFLVDDGCSDARRWRSKCRWRRFPSGYPGALARRGGPAHRRGHQPACTQGADDHLWDGLRVSELCALKAADIESAPEIAHVPEGVRGQGRQGALHAAQPAAASAARLLASVSAALVAVSEWCGRWPDGDPDRPAHLLGEPRRGLAAVGAFTRCAMLSPPICSKPGSISTPSSACSVTVIGARRCATSTWHARA